MNTQDKYENLRKYDKDDLSGSINMLLGGIDYYYQLFENGWPEPYSDLNDSNSNRDREKRDYNYIDDDGTLGNYIDDERETWHQFYSVLNLEQVNTHSLTSWTRNLIKRLKQDIGNANNDSERILWLAIREWRDLLLTLLYPYWDQESKIARNRLIYFNDKVRDIKTMMSKIPKWLSNEGQRELKIIVDNEIQIQYRSHKLAYYLSENKFPIYNPVSYLRDNSFMKWNVIEPKYKEDRLLNDKIFHTYWLLSKSLRSGKITHLITTILVNYGFCEEREDGSAEIDPYRRYKTSKKKLKDKIKNQKKNN